SALALGLMAAGAGLQFDAMKRGKVLAACVLSIRHLLLPLVAWVLARTLSLPPDQITVLMIFSAVPTASSAYLLAARMGYNGPYVAGLVTLSTVLGLLSLPLALGVLRSL
ncbi:MAG: AEC family transporter, partial [Burkholderiaceae bacterium]